MILSEKLDMLIDAMPSSAHKIRLMQAAQYLSIKLNAPAYMQNSAHIAQGLAEFILCFLTAIGFAAAVTITQGEDQPTVGMASTFAAIVALAPFIFNVLTKLKRSGITNIYPMGTHLTAQIGSIFAFLATFNQGTTLLGHAPPAEDIKNCLIVSMATVFTMSPSYTIIQSTLDSVGNRLGLDSPYHIVRSEQEVAEVQELQAIILEHSQVEQLYFTMLIFIICIINFNQGAQDFVKERGISNVFLLNSIVLPTTYVLANLIRYVYQLITRI